MDQQNSAKVSSHEALTGCSKVTVPGVVTVPEPSSGCWVKTLIWLLFSDSVGCVNVKYALKLMVSDVVLLYDVLSTSILTVRGVASLGLQAHRAEAAGAAAGVTAATAAAGVDAMKAAGVRAMLEVDGAGIGAAPICPVAAAAPRVVPSKVASTPGVSTEDPSMA